MPLHTSPALFFTPRDTTYFGNPNPEAHPSPSHSSQFPWAVECRGLASCIRPPSMRLFPARPTLGSTASVRKKHSIGYRMAYDGQRARERDSAALGFGEGRKSSHGVHRVLEAKASYQQAQVEASAQAAEDCGEEVEGASLQERADRLRELVAYHADLYYNQSAPDITDDAFDALEAQLRELEKQLPGSHRPDSTSAVGAPMPASRWEKAPQHLAPMLSLAAVYKEHEVYSWHGQVLSRLEQPPPRWTVEPKVDGVALSLRYKDGRLAHAATRGDGRRGEDVTENAKTISTIPHQLPPATTPPLLPSAFEVRGEVYMTLEGFEALQARQARAGGTPFKSARNAASGALMLDDPRAAAARHLSFVAYGLAHPGEHEGGGQLPPGQWACLQLLGALGFPINPDNRCFGSFELAMEFAKGWRARRGALWYEADGVVLKVDSARDQRLLGAVGGDPCWAVAWKFPATEGVTRLEAIEAHVGPSGSITPVARLQPLELGGVTVARASLHNFRNVERLGLRVGDLVSVQRAGDVIPQVTRSLTGGDSGAARWRPPTACPACGAALAPATDAQPVAFCPNADCPGRIARKVETFAGHCVDGLGPKAVCQLLEAGLVSDAADLYALQPRQLAALPRLGARSAEKTVAAIQASRGMGLATLLRAISIPRVGEKAAREIEAAFATMGRLLAATPEELQAVPGIGPGSAKAIHEWLCLPHSRNLLRKLREAGVTAAGAGGVGTEPLPPATCLPASGAGLQGVAANGDAAAERRMEGSERADGGAVSEAAREEAAGAGDATVGGSPPGGEGTGGALAGLSVVVTGRFHRESRKQVEELVKENGGTLKSSVTRRTDLIVAGEDAGPLKLEKARALGIKTIDETEFLSLIGHRDPGPDP